MLLLLVIAAYATLFFRMPRWLSIALGVGFIAIGLPCVLFGASGAYWDRQMSPGSDHGGTSTLLAGILVLLSRVKLALRVAAEALTAP